jgi:NADPH2:quinone reductase
MRAISIARFGGPNELAFVEVEQPRPGKGEIQVKVAYAGINFIDVYMRDGSYARSHTYKTRLPMVLGMQVEGFATGDRVAYCLACERHLDNQQKWRLKIPQLRQE